MNGAKSSEIDLGSLRQAGLARVKPKRPYLSVGMGTCGIGNGADLVLEALGKAVAERRLDAAVRRVGCFGFCAAEPLVMAYRPGKPLLLFTEAKPARAAKLAAGVADDEAFDRLAKAAEAKIEAWDFRTSHLEFGKGYAFLPSWDELPFFKGQEKIVLRDCGLIDPESIEEYLGVGGYSGLVKALSSMKPEMVIDELRAAKLRGRGGAGFPTFKKWEAMRASHGEPKYVICNADEGDPGAYMNRNEIESDPHMLVEGMALGAYATGASEGVVYVRAEYPLAVQRLRKAIEDARSAGLLGRNILGTKFSFDLELVMGAGAFVCGEETALIASVEGKAGRPLPRPPFPAQKGLNGSPTNINNVETWCNVPVIVARGGEWFSGFGTAASTGTKVFSLVGKVRNTGLVELPLGTRLDAMIYGMGEGAGPHKRIKAVQSGGPSGGCIPASLFKTTIDYEELAKIGAIMGSGGMVVMDQDNCMVDVARYFVGFTAGESCGKCTPCREGLNQMLRVLEAVSRGEAKEEDLAVLAELAETVKDSALCGLGQTAANPVLTTLKYFRDEYERHIRERRCEAGVCESLYLALCENSCPMHMNIPGYLQLLKENRIEEAFELTLRENPLPGTIGRICHFHCRMRCRRDQLDEPVSQGEIHRYLADTMYKMGRERAIYNKLVKEKMPPTGKKVAIVGAGPAGLTAAFYLVRLGHEVTVYDAHGEAGGIPRWGIPAYRLPKEVLAKEAGFVRKLGVRFVFNTEVGKDLSWARLGELHDAVLACVGAQKDMILGIPGEELPGVVPGYHLLEDINSGRKPRIGTEVVVIGGGNSAIDVARSALRTGARVTVAYRRARADMPANREELEGALEEGVEIVCMAQPVEAIAGPGGSVRALKVMKMKAGPIDQSGRPSPVATGESYEIPCDTLVVAVGEKVESSGLASVGAAIARDGRVEADPFTRRTANPKFFAAGDAVTGPATAAEAMGLAKEAAASIDAALMGEAAGARRFERLFRGFDYGMEVPLEPSKARMSRARRVPPSDRRGNFVEISLGYTGEQARIEAERCLRCDVRERARRPLGAAEAEAARAAEGVAK
ncbi:MAG TPA: NADH-ubiquinone oxidoreductase-F iron-sulfur binding region domain-containing protein [Spirochaetia bacterium]|nr:NADH-ubiquinone oxidoreductase-F iron-sulfur binding region domain-containing protein [Spirochaetia bacterium]HRZ63514.1 NADH-ubiquinone oxidoreductase-F iron-sulfur binding region domain-containing protein [Spirochaetia bacterium]